MQLKNVCVYCGSSSGRLQSFAESARSLARALVERDIGLVYGGASVGTLEQIFEAWTWAQLGLHQKPCGLLNASDYFAKLTTFLDHAVAEGFVKPLHRSMLVVESTPDAILDRFASYVAPAVPVWIGPAQT